MSEDASPVLNEQLWFTATILGVNGFTIALSNDSTVLNIAALVVSTVFTMFAVFLLVDRWGANADKLDLPPGRPSSEKKLKTLKEFWIETAHRIWVFPSNLLFCVVEFSGSFFYLLLVVVSWCGVVVSRFV